MFKLFARITCLCLLSLPAYTSYDDLTEIEEQQNIDKTNINRQLTHLAEDIFNDKPAFSPKLYPYAAEPYRESKTLTRYDDISMTRKLACIASMLHLMSPSRENNFKIYFSRFQNISSSLIARTQHPRLINSITGLLMELEVKALSSVIRKDFGMASIRHCVQLALDTFNKYEKDLSLASPLLFAAADLIYLAIHAENLCSNDRESIFILQAHVLNILNDRKITISTENLDLLSNLAVCCSIKMQQSFKSPVTKSMLPSLLKMLKLMVDRNDQELAIEKLRVLCLCHIGNKNFGIKDFSLIDEVLIEVNFRIANKLDANDALNVINQKQNEIYQRVSKNLDEGKKQ